MATHSERVDSVWSLIIGRCTSLHSRPNAMCVRYANTRCIQMETSLRFLWIAAISLPLACRTPTPLFRTLLISIEINLKQFRYVFVAVQLRSYVSIWLLTTFRSPARVVAHHFSIFQSKRAKTKRQLSDTCKINCRLNTSKMSLSKSIKFAFNNYPLISNSLIYGTLYVSAECSQQIITRKFLVNIRQQMQSSDLAPWHTFCSCLFVCVLNYRKAHPRILIRRRWCVTVWWERLCTHRSCIVGKHSIHN